MNEFGLQRLCFKLINNAAKQQQQQRIQILLIMTQIDETQTTRASSKHKSKRKQSTDVKPIASIGILCEFTGDIYSPNDLWDALKESRDVGGATPND
ncbi:unnamed protein product [Adineta steineri]|uniref:Uncharacterized protein n=1 Tax=Adineta steineri TaxID=433720 RepID=A0A819HPD9_9BILA|nr:unnamed protein product [Adineta steineri]